MVRCVCVVYVYVTVAHKLDCSDCDADPILERFRGRPQDLSPKARLNTWLGYVCTLLGTTRCYLARSRRRDALRAGTTPHLTATTGLSDGVARSAATSWTSTRESLVAKAKSVCPCTWM